MMLETWHELREPNDEAAWWIRKSGAEHFAEHLERLRGWVEELVARRGVAPDDSQPLPAVTNTS
jgi:broad specificity phosphatase PhoE